MIDRILYGRFYKGDIMSRMTKEEVKQRVCKAIVDEYIEYLAEGLTDLINIFDPEIIAIGGGISAQDDYLIKPLTKLIERDVYGGKLNAKIVKAGLGNNAGIVGSAMLGK